MSDLVERSEMVEALADQRRRMGEQYDALFADRQRIITNAKIEIERLQAFAMWIETWVSNPVGAFSVSALDGLFGMTRDKLAALKRSPQGNASE